MVVFGQKRLYSEKVVVFAQSGCNRAKVVIFEQKLLLSGKSGCKVVVFGKVVLFG